MSENWRVRSAAVQPPIIRDLMRRGAQANFALPALPPGYLWRPTPGVVPIPPGVRVRLTGLPTDESKVVPVSCVQIFSDQLNAVTISVGPENLAVAPGSRPNVAFYQLDAGRSATYWTDNVLSEFFDLGTLFAAHADADNTWFLYVTIYSPVEAS